MKKCNLLIILFIAVQTLWAQDMREKTLKEVIQQARKLEYPFKISAGYVTGNKKEQDTDFDVPTPRLTEQQMNILLVQQGIPKGPLYKLEYCKERSEVFHIAGTFPTLPNNYHLLSFSYNEDAGCGEKGFLATFTPKGKLIDTLTYYGGNVQTTVKGFIGGVFYGSIIEKDSIFIGESYWNGYVSKEEREEYAKQHPPVVKVYYINEQGKFIKRREYPLPKLENKQ